jgi:hypothetical protein
MQEDCAVSAAPMACRGCRGWSSFLRAVLTVLSRTADAIDRGVRTVRRGIAVSVVNLLILCGGRVNPSEFRQKFPGILHFMPIFNSSTADFAAIAVTRVMVHRR